MATGHAGKDENLAVVWDFDEILFERLLSAGPKPPSVDVAMDWLGASKPFRAYAAINRLRNEPEQAIKAIKESLQIVDKSELDLSKFDEYVDQLDHDEFSVRDKAFQTLMRFRFEARDRLETARDRAVSLESRLRLGQILRARSEKLTGDRNGSSHLGSMRTIFLLELLATEDARWLLDFLAKTGVDPAVVDEANAALRRLAPAKPKFISVFESKPASEAN